MSSFGKFFLILTLFYMQVNARQVPQFTSFTKNETVIEKRILIAMNGAVTENESFVYGICDSEEKVFQQCKCTVNVEAPAFYNATYKDTCIVDFKSEKPHQYSLSNLLLHAFGDDAVLFSWLVKDSDFKTIASKVRVVRMNTCKYEEVAFPSEEAHNIVPRGNTFSVIVKNKTHCDSDYCRLNFASDGKKLVDTGPGPVSFLFNMKFSYVGHVIPAYPRQAGKGFFVITLDDSSLNRKLLHVREDGKGTDLLTLNSPKIVKTSNSHDAFTVCYSTEQTNITCKLYDLKISPKLTVSFEFLDEPVGQDGVVRWMQPHNLQDGGFLLVTGALHPKSQKLESFSVIKVNPIGQKEKPLVINGLDFECLRLHKFYVSVSENDDDEVCFHFICEQRVYGENGLQRSLKFSAKCLPKKFVSMVKYRTSTVN